MPVHAVTKGLDIPISGVPQQVIFDGPAIARVAVLSRDFRDFKTRVVVEPGDAVRLGQPLLESRSNAAIRVVAPATGRVEAVHRGDKRALLSVVIAVDPTDTSAVTFASYSPAASQSSAGVRALLMESGLWTAFRTRPFSRVPAADAKPQAIFVTATDSQPLAPNVDIVLRGREDDFARGVSLLTMLTDGPVYVCRHPGSVLGDSVSKTARVHVEEFTGPHPAGTVGYHVHLLAPVHRERSIWHVGAQDVARIGQLFATGRLDTAQVVAIAGPRVKSPRLLRTTLGASTMELVAGELHDGPSRVISGSVLAGDVAQDPVQGFVGRLHQQVCVLAEGGSREFLGWLALGRNAYSVMPAFLSALLPRRRFDLNTSLRGSRRAMVPIGAYERVMPMDLMPTHLLRALTVGDVEWAEELGALELDEEDLALCSFVCPGKYEYGAALRRTLTVLGEES